MLAVIALVASLAGCVGFQPFDRPQAAYRHHHKVARAAPAPDPVPMPAPVPVAPPSKSPTFGERFRETIAGIPWLHN
jgi:hypothetical protein